MKFNKLPSSIKNVVGSLKSTELISALERKYKVDLKLMVILVAIGEIKPEDMHIFLAKRSNLSSDAAYEIEDELTDQIFNQELEAPVAKPQLSRIEKLRAIFREKVLDIIDDDEIIKEEYNEILRDEFVILEDFTPEEAVKQLMANEKNVTSAMIKLGDKSVASSIANWIQDYVHFSGSSLADFDSLKLSAYISNSPNVQGLTQNEKERIRKLLRLYSNLKFFPDSMGDKEITSWDFFPMEGQSPEQHVAVRVDERPIETKSPLDQLKDKYNSYRRHRQYILTVEDKMFVTTKGEADGVRHEFANAVRNREEDKVIACLFIMARQQQLASVLRDNPSWYASVAESIQAKYARDYSVDYIKQALANLKDEPQSLAGLSEFLQYILNNRLGMNTNDAALIGVEVGQILGGVFEGLAYGNQETGEFEWSRNKIDNGKLVSEV